MVGSGGSDGWCGRRGSGAAGCREAPRSRSLTLDRPRSFSVPRGAITHLRGHILWSHSLAQSDPFWAWAGPDHAYPQLRKSVLRLLLALRVFSVLHSPPVVFFTCVPYTAAKYPPLNRSGELLHVNPSVAASHRRQGSHAVTYGMVRYMNCE